MNLYYADAMDILKTLKDKSVDLILTDPPYDFTEFQRRAFHTEFVRVCKGQIIIFCPPENQWHYVIDNGDNIIDYNIYPNQYLFWIKPISTKNTSKSYSRFVEMIEVYGEGVWNADRHWSQYTNVFTDLVDDKEHPFAKPISMLIRLIRNHSNEGDIVLDPFMGSGTTGLACLQTKRNFIGIERDETYFELAEKRLS